MLRILPIYGFLYVFVTTACLAGVMRASTPSDRVEALPEATAADRMKKTVLRVALERAESSATVNPTYARELSNDVETALALPAATMAAATKDTPRITALRAVQAATGNPYINAMVAGVRNDLKKADFELLKATPDTGAFDRLPPSYSARNVGSQMEALWWLFVNPASPLRDDPAVLRLFLRRALAYVDTLATQTATLQAGQKLLDDFAVGPASGPLREFAQVYPGLLLPSQRKQWDAGLRAAADAMYGKAHGREGRYANIDLALAYELSNFGLYFHDQKFLDQARFLVEAQPRNVYQDGAVAYIGSQNETPLYQNTVLNYLTRYHKIWADQTSAAILQRMQPYPQTIGRLPDWWTAPSWKQMWDMGNESPGLACPAVPKDSRRWENAWLWVDEYTGKTAPPPPLPDNFTVLDRNTLGPRAWYGRWNYSATLRPIPTNEPGHAVLMGAQVAEPDFRLNAALMAAYPRVSFQNPKGKTDWAYLSSNMKAAVTMGRNFSACAATYQMAAYGSSTKGDVAPGWEGRQVWLGLPDRIVGLLGVVPTSDSAVADEVGAVLRLGVGGTVIGQPETLQTLAKDRYQYGDLLINVHDQNFAAVSSAVVPYRLPAAPVTEIVFRDAAGLKNDGRKPSTYHADASFFVLAEIRPAWAKGEAKVTRLSTPGGLIGFKVEVNARTYVVWANPTSGELPCQWPNDPALAPSASLHPSQDPAGLTGFVATPIQPAPVQTTLKAHALAVWVASADASDHVKGWTDFPEMLAHQPAALSP